LQERVLERSVPVPVCVSHPYCDRATDCHRGAGHTGDVIQVWVCVCVCVAFACVCACVRVCVVCVRVCVCVSYTCTSLKCANLHNMYVWYTCRAAWQYDIDVGDDDTLKVCPRVVYMRLALWNVRWFIVMG